MKLIKCARRASAVPALMFLMAAPSLAQSGVEQPWAEMETTSVMIGVGGQSGDGRLILPNLGTNCVYPFKVSGFGAGVQVSISKIAASGPVTNLNRLEDFSGQYNAAGAEGTVLAGAGTMTMTNQATKVTIALTSRTQGLGLGISGQGLTVNLPVPPANAPRVYVLEFGFNKDWLSRANRTQLDQMLAAWKCRFAKIEVVGRTDSVGKEDANLQLSIKRATAVRDYLIGAGVFPTRIEPLASGEHNQEVPTPQGVRLRANRVVVVTIKPW